MNHLLDTFLPGQVFAPIVTREFRPPKPDPAGILHIARTWGLDDGGNGLIMVRICAMHDMITEIWDNQSVLPRTSELTLTCVQVGDSLDDMTAGYRAGAATVLLVNEVNAHLASHEHTDLCIKRYVR